MVQSIDANALPELFQPSDVCRRQVGRLTFKAARMKLSLQVTRGELSAFITAINQTD